MVSWVPFLILIFWYQLRNDEQNLRPITHAPSGLSEDDLAGSSESLVDEHNRNAALAPIAGMSWFQKLRLTKPMFLPYLIPLFTVFFA